MNFSEYAHDGKDALALEILIACKPGNERLYGRRVIPFHRE